MDCIRDFEQMVMKEVENVVSRGDLTPADVHNIGEAVDMLKDLYTIEAMKQPEGGGYSQANQMSYGNSYGNSYGYGMRWMTPEEQYARNRYSGRSYDGRSYDGRSYDGRSYDEGSYGRSYERSRDYDDGYSGRRNR